MFYQMHAYPACKGKIQKIKETDKKGKKEREK